MGKGKRTIRKPNTSKNQDHKKQANDPTSNHADPEPIKNTVMSSTTAGADDQNGAPTQQSTRSRTASRAINTNLQANSTAEPELNMFESEPVRAVNNLKHYSLDVRNKFGKATPRLLKETQEEDPSNRLQAVRPAFAGSPDPFEVYANYLTMDLGEDFDFIYVYEVEGIEDSMTRPKKRVLMKSMIEKCLLLHHQRDSFATDYQKTIYAWKDLSEWDHKTNGRATEPDDELAVIPIVNNNAKNRSANATNPINFRLLFKKTVPLADLKNFCWANDSQLIDDGLKAALNTMITKAMNTHASDDIVAVGTNKIFAKKGSNTLNFEAKTAIRGYSYTVTAGMGCPLLNINPTTSVSFEPMNVADAIQCYHRDQLIGVRVWLLLERGVTMNHPALDETKRRTKTIAGFGGAANSEHAYNGTSGNPVNVWQHMSRTYPNTLPYERRTGGDADSVWVNLGGTESGPEQWSLAEDLCILPYQLYRGEKDPQLVASLIKEACRPVQKHRDAILSEFLPFLKLRTDREDGLELKGADEGGPDITIYPQLLSLPAHHAANALVRYGADTISTPVDGTWDLSAQVPFLSTTNRFQGKVHFLIPPNSQKERDIQAGYMKFFFEECSRNHMTGLPPFTGFTPQNTTTVRDFNPDKLKDIIQGAKKGGADLIVLILPQNNQAQVRNYAKFKIATDQLVGIKSLCICDSKAKRCFYTAPEGQRQKRWTDLPPSIEPTHAFAGYARNIAMKLNLRLGNTNHSVPAEALAQNIPGHAADRPIMILGADVVHPGAKAFEGTPSIAAVVGSIDKDFAAFRGSARLQRPSIDKEAVEIVQDMQGMVLERLRSYKAANNGQLPSQILYYRDGIDPGQYNKVLSDESDAIRLAWERSAGKSSGTSTKKDLKITTIIVTKRHNTRFYPTDNKQIRNGNCLPGTVVDSGVTMPHHFDFFLLSHNAIRGTARPAHYIELQDEMGFSAEQVQNLTNLLCYTYARSTTSVSYAPAAYYADHLCERVKQYLRPVFEKERGYEDAFNKCQELWDRSGNVNGYPWKQELEDTMFWM